MKLLKSVPVVVRDSREKVGQGWIFDRMNVAALKTGDYTLEGYEHVVCIERKGCVAELARNVCQKRFWAEIERMRVFPKAALILEFEMNDLMRWPAGSGLPKAVRSKIRVHKNFILSCIKKIESEYPNISVIFAGCEGKDAAIKLFREVVKDYEPRCAKG